MIKQHNCVNKLTVSLVITWMKNRWWFQKIAEKLLLNLKFSYRQCTFFNTACKRLLCNVLIQSNFDKSCTLWYPFLSKAFTKCFHTAQNKCIQYCLDATACTHILVAHFRKTNWLPVELTAQLCTAASTSFIYWNP